MAVLLWLCCAALCSAQTGSHEHESGCEGARAMYVPPPGASESDFIYDLMTESEWHCSDRAGAMFNRSKCSSFSVAVIYIFFIVESYFRICMNMFVGYCV